MAPYLHEARTRGVNIITIVFNDHDARPSTLPKVELREKAVCRVLAKFASCYDATKVITFTHTHTTYASRQHGLCFQITPAQRPTMMENKSSLALGISTT